MPEYSDPVSKARKLSAPELLKKFYKLAELTEINKQYYLVLDGRQANTPGRNKICVQSRRLADALVSEWNSQGEYIDPAAMPMTRLVNSALDAVSHRMDEVRQDIVSYAGSDALCYRAPEPEGLVAEQDRAWDPVLEWAGRFLGARFALAEGIVHVAQPDAALQALRNYLDQIDEPFAIAGFHVATTVTGSALLTLALREGFLDTEVAWKAAHVDEDWNISQWGSVEEAEARREKRFLDFSAAALALKLSN